MIKIFDISQYLRNQSARHLLFCDIIDAILNDAEEIVFTTHEGWNFKHLGIYQQIKDIVDRYNYSYEKIVFENTDLKFHDYKPFRFRPTKTQQVLAIAYKELSKMSSNCEWTGEFLFGQFMRAVRPSRLDAFYYMQQLGLKQYFYSSFNGSFDDIYEKEEINWLKENPEKYIAIKDAIPYSDFDIPRREQFNTFSADWQNWHHAYSLIGLDIVHETLTYDSFFITEKILRPLYFGRPFIVIGSPNFEKYLHEELGLYTFSEYIDKSYDNYGGSEAAKTVMNYIVPDLIKDQTVQRIHAECQKELSYNKEIIINLCKDQYK